MLKVIQVSSAEGNSGVKVIQVSSAEGNSGEQC